MSAKAQIRRSTLACAALFVIYFVAPVHLEDGPVAAAVRIGAALAAFIVLILAVKRLIKRQVEDPSAPLGGLVVAIVAGVLLFALADYGIAYWMPGEFTGLHTRLDALFFLNQFFVQLKLPQHLDDLREGQEMCLIRMYLPGLDVTCIIKLESCGWLKDLCQTRCDRPPGKPILKSVGSASHWGLI